MKHQIFILFQIAILSTLIHQASLQTLYLDNNSTNTFQDGTLQYPFTSLSQTFAYITTNGYNSTILSLAISDSEYSLSNYTLATQSLQIQPNQSNIAPLTISFNDCTFSISNLSIVSTIIVIGAPTTFNTDNLWFSEVTISMLNNISINTLTTNTSGNTLLQSITLNLLKCLECSILISNFANLLVDDIIIYAESSTSSIFYLQDISLVNFSNSSISIQNLSNFLLYDLTLESPNTHSQIIFESFTLDIKNVIHGESPFIQITILGNNSISLELNEFEMEGFSSHCFIQINKTAVLTSSNESLGFNLSMINSKLIFDQNSEDLICIYDQILEADNEIGKNSQLALQFSNITFYNLSVIYPSTTTFLYMINFLLFFRELNLMFDQITSYNFSTGVYSYLYLLGMSTAQIVNINNLNISECNGNFGFMSIYAQTNLLVQNAFIPNMINYTFNNWNLIDNDN